MTLKELKAARAEQTKIMSDAVSSERSAGESLTDEMKAKFDTASEKVKAIDADIARMEELRSLETATAVKVDNDSDVEEFRNFLRNQEVRTQTVGTNSQGGFTVGSQVSNQVVTAMKAYSGMIASAAGITTATGGELSYPTMDDTANEAVIKAETDTRRSGPDVVFGSIKLGAFVYDSGIIKISNELVKDSAANVEQIVIDALAERISRKLNKDMTIGAGTTEPSGIITQSTLGVTAAAEAAITADELMDMSFSVDSAYTAKAKFMMNSNTLKAISKLKDGQNNYLLTSATAGTTKTLFGYPIVVNELMPDMATGTKPIIFGDLSKYLVRTVEGISIFKFNELYQEDNSIGYKASARFDGTLLNPAAVKHLVMA